MTLIQSRRTIPATATGVKGISYIGTTIDSVAATTFTFTDHAIGAADSTRLVVVVFNYYDLATRTVSSATIGGSAATIVADVGTSGGLRSGSAIISRAVASGTTATIAITFTAEVDRCNISVYRLVNLDSNTAHATATDEQDLNQVDADLNVQADGIIVAVSGARDAQTTSTWVGVTKDTSTDTDEHAAASASGLGAETPRTVNCTWPAGTGRDNAIAAASYA
jgi:hypothetical protein